MTYDPRKPITLQNHPPGFRFPPLRRSGSEPVKPQQVVKPKPEKQVESDEPSRFSFFA